MKTAFIGPPHSGKSTLLAAVSGQPPAPAGSTKAMEAVVPVPDERVDWLGALYHSKKKVLSTIDILDLPGLNFADEAGRAAARRVIAQAKAVDLFVVVVRAFEGQAVPAYRGSVDPRRDVREILQELLLADFELVTTRIEKLEKQAEKPTKTQAQDRAELALHRKLLTALEAGEPVAAAVSDEGERRICQALGLMTIKPIMAVVNVGENDTVRAYDLSGLVAPGVPVVSLSAKIEAELAQLDPESRSVFMAELGLTKPAAHRFVRSCYETLGLISFLTTGEDESRAWPIRRGTIAVEAAGKVHSDIQRGFIRAETMAFHELKQAGDEKSLRAAGRKRLEGKTYVVQDGDIIDFRFNI